MNIDIIADMIGVLLSPIICAFIFGDWDNDKKK